MEKRNLIVIPARMGSKRLPGKNTKLLGGLPLVLHSINYAKNNKKVSDVIVVTTDDPKVENIALSAGVKVIKRPAYLSTDHTTTVSVLKHIIEVIKEVDNIILLQPTNPLRPDNLLREAWSVYNSGTYDSLLTVSKTDIKIGKIDQNKYVPLNYEMGQRSQDLDPVYFENGLLYITRASCILNGNILGEDNFAFIVNHPYSRVDIDTQEDLDYAEFLFQKEYK